MDRRIWLLDDVIVWSPKAWRRIARAGACIAAVSFAIASPGLALADDAPAPKPILFYQVFQAGQYNGGGDTSETEDNGVRKALHDRLVPALMTALGTQVIDIDLGDPKTTQITESCRAHGAVGAVELENTWQVDRSRKSAFILTLTFKNCTGTQWFSLDGSTVSESIRDSVLGDMEFDVIAQVTDKVKKVAHDTPNATSNFVHYGFYMNDADADSFWTLAIEKGKATVDYCDPVGTAYRAGLRVGDEVVAVDGADTRGVDQAQLNAILETAKRKIPWVLAVRTGDGATRELNFRNEPVSWYVAHPES